jgi:competence protein ComEC
VNLQGWVVADESASHRYSFSNLVLEVGAAVTLFTGCGQDAAASRYWCNVGSAVWNNAGDMVFLRDSSGNIVASLKY